MEVEAPAFSEYLVLSQFLVCLARSVPSRKMKPHWKLEHKQWEEKVENCSDCEQLVQAFFCFRNSIDPTSDLHEWYNATSRYVTRLHILQSPSQLAEVFSRIETLLDSSLLSVKDYFGESKLKEWIGLWQNNAYLTPEQQLKWLTSLVVDLEVGTKWSAVVEVWVSMRPHWLKRVSELKTVTDLCRELLEFEDALFTPTEEWTSVRNFWRQRVYDLALRYAATKPEYFQILELSEYIFALGSALPYNLYSHTFQLYRKIWESSLKFFGLNSVPSLQSLCFSAISYNIANDKTDGMVSNLSEDLIHSFLSHLKIRRELSPIHVNFFFSTLPSLTSLSLSECAPSDEDFWDSLQPTLNLRYLDVSWSKYLTSIPFALNNLVVVDVSKTTITDDGMHELLANNSGLEKVYAKCCSELEVVFVGSHFLTLVDVYGCENLTLRLGYCPKLEILNINETVTMIDLDEMQMKCPKLVPHLPI